MTYQKWPKLYIEFNIQKGIEAEKNVDKDGREFYKLMKNAIYRKAMGNMRKRVDLKLVNNEKGYLKWTSKPSFVKQQIFEKNLVAIHKIKITLILTK